MKFKTICFSSLVLLIITISSMSESLVCPDSSKCSDGMTCCKWSSGKYGCCPLASAQCCADGLHCCPNGTQCNDKEGSCDQIEDKRMQLMVEKVKNITDIVCPGGEYQCPDDYTCCQMTGSEWGCCPLPNAVCCSDQIHCCPADTTCNASGCEPK